MKKNLIITLSEEYIGQREKIAKMLSNEGLDIVDIYEFGVITGTIDEKKIETIKKHKEIASLSEASNIKIPPPESEIQ